jgi:hypothetical protein
LGTRWGGRILQESGTAEARGTVTVTASSEGVNKHNKLQHLSEVANNCCCVLRQFTKYGPDLERLRMPCAPQLNSQAARDANHGTSCLLVHATLAGVCVSVREAMKNAAAGRLGLHTPLVMHPRLLVQAGLAAVCLIVTGAVRTAAAGGMTGAHLWRCIWV